MADPLTGLLQKKKQTAEAKEAKAAPPPKPGLFDFDVVPWRISCGKTRNNEHQQNNCKDQIWDNRTFKYVCWYLLGDQYKSQEMWPRKSFPVFPNDIYIYIHAWESSLELQYICIGHYIVSQHQACKQLEHKHCIMFFFFVADYQNSFTPLTVLRKELQKLCGSTFSELNKSLIHSEPGQLL